MAQEAPNFFEIMPELLSFIGDSILVAHNAGFDMRFLNYEIGRVVPRRKLINPNFCTVRLSRKLLPNIKNHRLHTIAEHYNITIHNRHRAFGDALATAFREKDYPVLQVLILAAAVIYVVINLLVDLLYFAVDPRLRLERAGGH